MKKLPIILLCTGILLTVVGLVMPLIAIALNIPLLDRTVHIIGGADAPTYWFLFPQMLNGIPYWMTVVGIGLLPMALVAWIALKLKKSK